MIPRPAAASSDYPPLVKSYWGVKKLPVSGADGCPLCHTSDPGMLGTANQKFAATLKSFGLTSSNDGALRAALDKNKSKKTDSDGDGFSDYEELVIDGTNPNSASDHVAPMPMGTVGSGGSGTGPSLIPEAGGAADAVGAGGGDSLPECTTTTEEIYPTLDHGCSIGSTSKLSGWWSLFSIAAIYGLRRARRAQPRARKRA